MKQTLKDRLFSKLEETECGCLVFTGAKNKAGYGSIYSHSEGKKIVTRMTHRVAWELVNGPIINNLCVLHRCDNPSCCNPEHLFLGTDKDNMQDKSAKGRAKPGPCSKSEWWTQEKKEERRNTTKKWKAERKELSAVAAGVPSNWKFCPSCKAWKPQDAFGKNKARHDGLHAQCKPCKNELNTESRRKRMCITSPRRKTRSDKIHFI